jgi:hemerythrin-like domain-containing protein
MLRDKNLIPLSHQHQHALALCVRIERASPISDGDLGAWQTEISQLFRSEIGIHFAAEEQVVFPAARRFAELAPLVDDLLADHGLLRRCFAKSAESGMSADDLVELARRLSAHIRNEERQLFERMQELLNPEDLAGVGRSLEAALKGAAQVCVVPTDATRLRPAK